MRFAEIHAFQHEPAGNMKIHCYECGREFKMTTGFYIERRVTNPDAIPAETELTGYGYCSPECAARHHILEEDIELQDIGNYEETDASLLMTSPDGGVRGEVLQIGNVRKKKRRQRATGKE